MTTTARDGRRRRILHEGAAAPEAEGPAGVQREPATHARYTPRDGSASFAVASALLPRSPLAWLSYVAILGGVIALLGWADQFGVALSGAGPLASAKRLLLLDAPGSLAIWWETLLWAAVAGQAVLLFGMRQHRTDDTRGAYRWWLIVAGVSLGTSLATATTAANAVASQLAAVTGFSPLAADAFWWLAPGVLVTGAVGLRCLLEVKESPLAALAGVASLLCLAAGGLASAGLVPESLAAVWAGFTSPLVGPVMGMVGASLTLLGMTLYARRIAREAQGEVAPPTPKPAAKPTEKATTSTTDADQSEPEATPQETPTKRVAAPKPKTVVVEHEEEQDEPDLIETPAARRAKKRRERQAAKAAATQQTEEETKWVSGPEADEDYDDGPQRRKLSKAERKRLRREKARRAA